MSTHLSVLSGHGRRLYGRMAYVIHLNLVLLIVFDANSFVFTTHFVFPDFKVTDALAPYFVSNIDSCRQDL